MSGAGRLTDIGQGFGGRDHSTVANSCAWIADALGEDDSLRIAASALAAQIHAPTPQLPTSTAPGLPPDGW